MNNYIKLIVLKYPKMAKCECCDRVKDNYFKADIMDHEDNDLIVGSITLCKQCGENLNKILGNKMDLGDKITKSFTFNR